MKEKVYKEQCSVSNTKAKISSLTKKNLRTNISRKNALKNDESKKKKGSFQKQTKMEKVEVVELKKIKQKSVGLKEGESTKVELTTLSGHVCQESGCSKVFRWRSNLERHIKGVHRGEKPFTCRYQNCAKSFGTESNLKRHQAVHQRENNLKALAKNTFNEEEVKKVEGEDEGGDADRFSLWRSKKREGVMASQLNLSKEENEAVKPPACHACEGCKKKKGCEVILRWKRKNSVTGEASPSENGKPQHDANTNMIQVKGQKAGSYKKRKVEGQGLEESLAPLGRKLVEVAEKENGDDISFLGFKRKERGMQMTVTVGDVLRQRENPLPYSWRCHLDKSEEREVSQNVRMEENRLTLRKSVRNRSFPSRFKSLKERKELEDDMPEEIRETGKRKTFDPFVDFYYDCAVPDCQDCKELERF